jgi:ACS family tartrate transporter-like MFS transporter
MGGSESLAPVGGITGIHIGTGAMNSVIGVLRDQTGSFPTALIPLCALTATGSLLVFLVGKQNHRAAKSPLSATRETLIFPA